jgi:hypothetical protein
MKLVTDDQIASALVAQKGNITNTAKALGIKTTYIHMRLAENEAIQAAWQECTDDLIDLAVDKLRDEISNGNTKAILFALDKLGHSRGFVTRKSVTHEGNMMNPIQVQNKIDFSAMSLDEKKLLLKIAKDKAIDVDAIKVN